MLKKKNKDKNKYYLIMNNPSSVSEPNQKQSKKKEKEGRM